MLKPDRHRLITATGSEIETTLEAWRDTPPGGGLVAFVPERQAGIIPALQTACKERGLGLVGALFPALIADDGFSSDSCWLMGFDRMPPNTLLAEAGGATERTVAHIAAFARGAVEAAPAESEMGLFTIFDATLPNICQILGGLNETLGDDVVYAGVNAGSETFQPLPCLFDNERFIQGGVWVMAIEGPLEMVSEHGFDIPMRIMLATETANNRILSIDQSPAFEAYQAALADQYGMHLTEENFYEHAVHYPFGILPKDSQMTIRIPVGFDPQGGLACVGEVPQGSVITILKAPDAEEIERSGNLMRTLPDAGGGDALVFYCAGRRLHLGVTEAGRELARIRERTHAGALLGALSLGEIATNSAFEAVFHNAVVMYAPLDG